MKLSYVMYLMVSADSPDQLRACDVDRVMNEAEQHAETNGFRTWLLAHNLRQDTRERLAGWFPVNPDCDMCFGQGEVKVWPKAQIDFDNPQNPQYLACTKCKEAAAL